MNSPSIDNTVQPYLGTDVGAFVLALAAVLCAVLWRRDHERGMGWLAAGIGLIALWFSSHRLHVLLGIYVNHSPWWYVLAAGLLALAIGLVYYLGVPAERRRMVLVLTLHPVILYILLLVVAELTEAQVHRAWYNIFVGMFFGGLGALAFWAAGREPRAGHGYVGAALLLIPALSILQLIVPAESVLLRYWALLPVLVLAITLPMVSLVRQRRALETEVARRTLAEQALQALNASLEQQVAERTRALSDANRDLRASNQDLESFSYSVSHDLRTPLRAISGIAGTMRMVHGKTLPDEVRELVGRIDERVKRMARLIDDLLQFARTGRTALKVRHVDMHSILNEVVDELKPAAKAGLRFSIGDLPPVIGDAALLRQVWQNLVSNAIKFTGNTPEPLIEIGATRLDGKVEYFVRDNGAGFDMSHASRLFGVFQRLHGASDFEGTGVGLAIVQRIVQRHGGEVGAEGKPDCGATVRFSLPSV